MFTLDTPDTGLPPLRGGVNLHGALAAAEAGPGSDVWRDSNPVVHMYIRGSKTRDGRRLRYLLAHAPGASIPLTCEKRKADLYEGV